LGYRTTFRAWCEALIAKLAEHASGSLLCSSAGSSEELLQAMIEHPSQHILVSCREPGSCLHRIVGAANGQCVVVLADPRACVAELTAGHGSYLIEIVRGVANSCATLTFYLSIPGALVLRPEDHSSIPSPRRRIADHLQLPSADEDILAVLDTVSPLDPNALVTVAWENRYNASELSLINGALAAFAEYFTGAPLGNLVWAPKLFIVGDTHQRLNGPIDITGRGRCLIYGPYIRLPPGRWTANVAVDCAELGGDKDFRVDVAATVKLHEVSINVVDQGGVRVSTNRAAFEGWLALDAVTLRPQQGSKELLELLTTLSHA
jgi:hypothetical protein